MWDETGKNHGQEDGEVSPDATSEGDIVSDSTDIKEEAAEETAETAEETAEETGAEETVAEESAGEDAVSVDADGAVTESADGDDAEAAPAEEKTVEEAKEDDKFNWYVLHTYSGHEDKVCRNIRRAIDQAGLSESVPRVLIPTESVAEMKNGKKTIQTKKFFPSYVLVQMEMSDDTWRVVSNTPGVTRFVGVGAKPQPISDDEIERILGRIEGSKGKPTPTVPYHIGEHVKVTDGPFTDFTGIVDEINPERGKLKVMVSIFGRATPVELDFLQVKNL